MKRWIFALLSFCLVGLVSAYNNENYPPIRPENVADLQEVERLGTGAMNPALAWLPDGSRLVVGGLRGLYVYEDLNAQPEFINLGNNIQSLLFAGEILFFTDDTKLYVFSLPEQRVLYSLDGQKPLAVSDDGMLLAYEVAMGVRVLEIDTGEIQYELSYEGILEAETTPEDDWYSQYRFLSAQFFNEDSQLVVDWMHIYAGGWEGRSMRDTDIWTLATESRENVFRLYTSGRFERFIGFDENDQQIMLPELENLPRTGLDYGFDFRPDFVVRGSLFAAPYRGEDGMETGIWDWQTGEQIASLPASGLMVFSPDGSLLAINRQIFEIATGEEIANLRSDIYEVYGQNILKRGVDDSLRVLDAASLEELSVLPLRSSELSTIKGEIFIHRNEMLAFWIDPVTGQEKARFESEIPLFDYWNAWNFNSNSTFALNRVDGDRVYLWNLQTGEEHFDEQYIILEDEFYEGDYMLIRTRDTVALFNPENGDYLWTFPYPEANLLDTVLFDEAYLMGIYSDSVVVYDFQSQEMLFDFGVGSPDFFDWRGNLVAYIHNHRLIVRSLPEGHKEQMINVDLTLEMFFVTDTVVVWWPEWGNDAVYYDVTTGAVVESPQRFGTPQPALETESLNFYRNEQDLQIQNKAGDVLGQITIGSFFFLGMSSDESRILIQYADGTVGIWAVRE